MEAEYKKKFLKELAKLPSKYAKTIEESLFLMIYQIIQV
jgi:mRNA-degrading endonuclease RelE of RelBE toxin-antitoxin system